VLATEDRVPCEPPALAVSTSIPDDVWQGSGARPWTDTGDVNPSVTSLLLLVSAVAAVSLWVLHDARSRVERHDPVVVTMGSLTVDKPEVWAALCLLAVVLFLPLYLVARTAQ
jgi:hypothetical protein